MKEFLLLTQNNNFFCANNSLPGQGGLFNQVNFHLYHYAGNNPVKYVDPDGETPITFETKNMQDYGGNIPHTNTPFAKEGCTFSGFVGIVDDFRKKKGMEAINWQEKINKQELDKYFNEKGELLRDTFLQDFTDGKLKIKEDTKNSGRSPSTALKEEVADKTKGRYVVGRAPITFGKQKGEHEIGIKGLNGDSVDKINTSEWDERRNYNISDNSINFKLNRILIIEEVEK